MTRLAALFKHLREYMTGRPGDDCLLNCNVGVEVLEWTSRAEAALNLLLSRLPVPTPVLRVGDFGCGRQTLRRLLPANWVYLPFDSLQRTPDTVVCDFNSEVPPGNFDTIVVLGVLEYLDRPEEFLMICLDRCRYLLFSYNGFTTEDRRRRQGWCNNLEFAEIEALLDNRGSAILGVHDLGSNERIYLTQGGR